MAEKLSFRRTYRNFSVTLTDDLKTRVDNVSSQLKQTRSYVIDAAVRRSIGELEVEAKALAEKQVA